MLILIDLSYWLYNFTSLKLNTEYSLLNTEYRLHFA